MCKLIILIVHYLLLQKKREYNARCAQFIKQLKQVTKIENRIRFLGQFNTRYNRGRDSIHRHLGYIHDYLIDDPNDKNYEGGETKFKVALFGTASGIWRIYRFIHWSKLKTSYMGNTNYKGLSNDDITVKRLLPVVGIRDMQDTFNCLLYVEMNNNDCNIWNVNKFLIMKGDMDLLSSAKNEYLPDLFINEKTFYQRCWREVCSTKENEINTKRGKPLNFYKSFATSSALLTRKRYSHCKIANIARKIYGKIVNDFNAMSPPTERTICNCLYDIKLGKPKIKSNDGFELVIPDEYSDYTE